MKPILWPFGATTKESWVDLEDDVIHIHFGHLFDHKLALSKVEKAEPAQWSLLRGLGIRIGGKGRLGVLAAYDHVRLAFIPDGCVAPSRSSAATPLSSRLALGKKSCADLAPYFRGAVLDS